MEKRIEKNEKNSQHRSQNSYFSPLAEMASEAKMWTSSSHFGQQVNCWFTEKIIWQVYNKAIKLNSTIMWVRTKWKSYWRCTAGFSWQMYFRFWLEELYRENDENVTQNLAGPPPAVVCSEAILWSVTSQFAAHVKCHFTEKIIW